MKNILLITGLLFLVFLMQSCNTKDDIVSQNNMVFNDQIEFYQLNDNLFTLFETGAGKDEYIKTYDSLTIFLKTTIQKYDTIPPASNDSSLIQAIQVFLSEYQNLVYQEYQEILHIVIKPAYLFESADLRILDSLYETIDIKQIKIDQDFSEIQEAYLKNHDIEISNE